ncbi:hypothetical protein [Maribacter antarcticus]|uniref:hypothetical protein n=1 Tax=Maribacter antarcticus TaxID=505250 RepID=UPI00047DC977|nr:hypothetical protein [Maribacter antarcticus]
MNKVFSILLSVVILLQSFGMHADDLVQIDEFITHGQFHSAQYGDNAIVFISKHYGELKAAHEEEHQEEREDHERLPFQQQSHTMSVMGFTLGSVIPEFRPFNFYYKAPLSSLHSDGILQPPRLV